ncbi:MAG: hypothetical protein AAF799_31365 [Myxococcota bacterium]
MTTSNIYAPTPDHYVAAHVIATASGGVNALEIVPDNAWANGTFPVRLFALKVENKTSAAVNPLKIELETLDSGGNVIDRADVDVYYNRLEFDGHPLHYGAWIFVAKHARRVKIRASRDGFTAAETVLALNMQADLVQINANGKASAKSQQNFQGGTPTIETGYVYAQGGSIRVSNNNDATCYAWKSDDGQSWSLVSGWSIDYNETKSLQTHNGSQTITRFQLSESNTTAPSPNGRIFHVYDSDGDQVTVFEDPASGKLMSAPYAVTPSAYPTAEQNGRGVIEMLKHGGVQSTIKAWSAGIGSGPQAPWDPALPSSATDPNHGPKTVTPTPTPTPLVVPFTTQVTNADNTVSDFVCQPAIHWDHNDDPKVIIRQKNFASKPTSRRGGD